MSNLREVLNTWDNADVELNKKIDNTNLSTIVASATASAMNSKTIEINGTGKAVEKLVVEGKTSQDGTPSPSNPIEVKGVGDYDEETGKYKIPISCGGTTKNVYLDTPLFNGDTADLAGGVAEKKWGMIVVDENTNITKQGSGTVYYIALNSNTNAISSHFEKRSDLPNVISLGGFTISQQYIYFSVPNATTEALAKEWLKNNPVAFVYGLTNTTKETFDGVEIPTSVGKNTLSVDTDVTPKSVEAVTFGDYYSKSQIDKMFADVQADLAAMAELL